MAVRAVRRSVLPGFGMTMGFTVFYLSLIVLIPLATLPIRTASMGWDAFWTTVTDPRVVASYRVTLSTSFVAAVVNGDDAEDIGKRIELRQPHINRGANRPDEDQGALWLLGLAWAVFDKVQLCHVFLAFLFYNCCHALTATDAHGGKTQLAALALETVCQSHQHAGAGRANWVTQGDARAPSIQAGIIPC